MHRMAIYSGTGEINKHKGCNKTYISDEQLHTMEFCIYHGIKVQVEGLEGEHRSQMCWCTGRQSWRGGDRQNDWVWVKQYPGRRYSTLNGHLPWQLQWLFKIKLLNKYVAFVEYRLALALTTIHQNSANLDLIPKFKQLKTTPADVAM